jgi:hypothetical protein
VFSGRETNLGKITFISPAMSRLSVIATNETTMSASRVNLIVKPRGVDHIVGTTNPSSLPFGEYDIYAFTGKLPQFLAVAQTSIPLFLSHERVSLSLKQGARLTGSVVSEMPNRWVPVFGAELILGSRDVLESASFSLRSAQDGTFKMESVPSGRFKVKQLISPDGLCTESVTQESRDVLRQGMEVRGDSIHLQWIMTTTNLRVQGVVKHPSGKHLPNATIILVHSNLEMDSLDYTTVADQNGRFEINCVVPGRYRAYALESSDRVALVRSEQFQASFQGLLTEINTSRGITNLDIEAILGR